MLQFVTMSSFTQFEVLVSLVVALALLVCGYLLHLLIVGPWTNPLRNLPGPKSNKILEMRHMLLVMEYVYSIGTSFCTTG